MTIKVVVKDQIRAEILKVLSGYCFRERHYSMPSLYILSPWISDVQLEIDAEVFESDELWFGLDYGIRSINLAYALLLLELDFGARINIVTLPPTEENYRGRVTLQRNLLDFLDEIGCSIFVNPELHSKLILSNDLALIGSFNLSKAALFEREEIGVSIDDISNLKILEHYADDVADSSAPYGFNAKVDLQSREGRSPITRVTRGWLYKQIVERWSGEILPDRIHFDEFLIDHVGTKSYYLDGIVKEVSLDLEAFYVKAVMTWLKYERKEEELSAYLRTEFNYQGKYEIGQIAEFLKSKLAREHVPMIPPRILSMSEPRGLR